MRKRKSAAIVCTSLVLCLLTLFGVGAQALSEASKNFDHLDVNGDGRVNISDVTALLDYLSTGCSHETEIIPGKEASCFEDGLTEGRRCLLCGEVVKQQQIIPGGHVYDENGLCTGCGSAKAAELDEQGFSYTLSPDGSYYILSSVGRNEDTVVTVPDMYNGLPVSAIGIGAFYECDYITEMILPDSIWGIGSLAFYGCKSLSKINLPMGVIYIGYSSFQDCTALESITIPVGVMEIYDSAFENCESLTELILPSFMETVGKRAFYGCTGLSSVKVGVGVCSFGAEAFGGCTSLNKVIVSDLAAWCQIEFDTYDANPLYYAKNLYFKDTLLTDLLLPEGVERISAHAFRNASAITALVLPESLETVGAHAFSGCGALETVTFPEGLSRIEESAFAMCGSLTRLTLPDTLEYLGEYAFYHCSSVKRAYLPLSIPEIGARSFADCKAMTKVYMPDYTRKIGEGAFAGCSALTSLELPAGLQEIGKDAFYNCVALKSVSLFDGLSAVGADAFGGCIAIEEVEIETLAGWCAIDFASGTANPLAYADAFYADGNEISDVVIPRGVTRIGSYSFYAFPMEALVVPKDVTHIGDHAFDHCASLESVTMQKGLVSVGDGAFAYCTALSKITLPKGLTTLGKGAFADCAVLEEAVLPLGLTEVADDTFARCPSLTFVDLPEGIVRIGANAFYQCTTLPLLDLPEALSSVGQKAFYGCSSLSSVTLPDGLLTVEDDAYYGCTSLAAVHVTDLPAFCEILFGTLHSNPLYYAGALYLDGTKVTSLKIPEGTLYVGDYVFANYKSLTSVSFPISLTRVGNCAFMSCTSITTANLYDNVTQIGANAFSGCTALRTLRLSSALTEIGGSAFAGCSRITAITLSKGLLTVGSHAFSGCSTAALSGLPEGLVSVGDGAFAGCRVPAQLFIPESVKLLGEGAFEGCTGVKDIFCSHEKAPLGWADDWNGSDATVHWLPYWSIENGTVVMHTPVTDKGYDATCTEQGWTDSVYCADCGAVLVEKQAIPALGGVHEYADGSCVRCGAKEPYSWTLENGVLTVSGTGALTAATVTSYPWYERRNEITEIVVTGDITEIGQGAFSGCENVTRITLGERVTVIGQDAFSYNTSLKELVFLAPVSYIGQGTVYLCTSLEKVTLTGQTKNAFLQIATVYPYNSAYEEVMEWVAEKETVGTVDPVTKGDSWEYVVYEESSSSLTATAPSGWLDKTDSAVWTVGTAPFNGDTFGFGCFSAYLRKTFTVENAAELKELTMQIIYDENPAIYLNGQLLWSAEGYHDSGYVTINLTDKLSLLKDGENILCVTFSNVYGGSTFDMSLTYSDEMTLIDEDGNVIMGGATSSGFVSFGGINDPMNVTDGDQDTVCGSAWDSSAEQSITVAFKGAVVVDSVYVQCKNEGSTAHEDGITRGSYDIYLVNGDTLTKINSAPVLARTESDGGAIVTLPEGMQATGVKIVITSWQGDAWACLADVIVSGREIS